MMNTKSRAPRTKPTRPQVKFCVRGKAITQGSKIAFQRAGRVTMIESGNKKTKTLPANRLKDWRELVAAKARQALLGYSSMWDKEVRVKVKARFMYKRPDYHLGAKGQVLKGKPVCPRVDLDKLARALGDSMSGILYRDDSQICHWDITKTWGSVDAVEICASVVL